MIPKLDISYLFFKLIQQGKGKGKSVDGNELSISDFLPTRNTQGDNNARQNGKTGATVQGDDPEGLPAPQPCTRKPVRDGNEKKNPKAST